MAQVCSTELNEIPSIGAIQQPSSPSASPDQVVASNEPGLSKRKTIVIIISVACSTLLSGIVNGMFTVEIPTIANDIHLNQKLLLWPQSIVSLVSACTLLLAGSLSDVFGSKSVYLVGSFLQCMVILGAGLARNAPEILIFRGFMGLAQSLCLTSSVSMITNSFPAGRGRNIAFACMGGGQPLGFSVGLVLAGIFTETIGWRYGLYMVAGINAAITILAAFGIQGSRRSSLRDTWLRLQRDIDWMGTFIASTSLAMLCFVLASVTADASSIKSPSNVALLCISITLMPAFVYWMHHQVRRGQPALIPLERSIYEKGKRSLFIYLPGELLPKIQSIPNDLWRSRVFSGICLGVFFTWASFNSFEQLFSLWLQVLQHLSPLQTSVRFLPQTVVGVIVNAVVGLFVHRLPVFWLVFLSTICSLPAPILMGLSGIHQSYWTAAFPAISLIVVGADSLYTVANLLISDRFPKDAQGLTGGVFNTIAQVGKSMGLALSAVISNTVTEGSAATDAGERLAAGYRASIWFYLGLNVMTLCIVLWGLRGCGRIESR